MEKQNVLLVANAIVSRSGTAGKQNEENKWKVIPSTVVEVPPKCSVVSRFPGFQVYVQLYSD